MSYAIYIGAAHSRTGHGWLAGYGDEPSSHWLEIMPEASHPPGSQIEIGVGPKADMPGRRSLIAQAPKTLRNLRVSYSYYLGVPAPITNGGLNARGVAVRDVWSTSRDALIAITPKDQQGLTYSDLAGAVLDWAGSAREAVQICADLIARHGEASYGGNSHIFADAQEAWVMIQFAGGQGLWLAERLGSHSIRVSRPGYIQAVPVDQPDHPDYLYSPNFVSFATQMGWYSGGIFDANQIYGDGKGRWEGCVWIEEALQKIAQSPGRIGLEDLIWALRTPKLTGDTAGYGQIVPLVTPLDPGLAMMWHCPTGALAAPFAPVFLGQAAIPPEFGPHRYLTTGEAHRFMDMRKADGGCDAISLVSQHHEASRAAVYEAKRLMILLQLAGDDDLARITRAFTGREARLAEQTAQMLAAAEALILSGNPSQAYDILGYFSQSELLAGHRMVMALSTGLEAEMAATGRLRPHQRRGFGPGQDHKGFSQVW